MVTCGLTVLLRGTLIMWSTFISFYEVIPTNPSWEERIILLAASSYWHQIKKASIGGPIGLNGDFLHHILVNTYLLCQLGKPEYCSVDGTTPQVTLLQDPFCMWREILCGRQPRNKKKQIINKLKKVELIKVAAQKIHSVWQQAVGTDGKLLNNNKK